MLKFFFKKILVLCECGISFRMVFKEQIWPINLEPFILVCYLQTVASMFISMSPFTLIPMLIAAAAVASITGKNNAWFLFWMGFVISEISSMCFLRLVQMVSLGRALAWIFKKLLDLGPAQSLTAKVRIGPGVIPFLAWPAVPFKI